MRFLAAISRVVLWLATTVALAVAIPAAWMQLHVIDADGYAAMAQKAAGDPALQSAMAAELTTRAMALIAAHGGDATPSIARRCTMLPAPLRPGERFRRCSPRRTGRGMAGWLFNDPRSGDDGNQWVVDVAPMLKDSSIQQLLSSYNVKVPANLTVPVTVSVPQPLRQGQLSRLSAWGPWVSIGAAALSGGCALLTLVAARRRGKALTSLGVSALLVGAGGWAGIEIGGRYINDALNRTTGDIRRIAEVMVGHAEASLHQWLNLTLLAGAALVGFGVIVAIVGSLRK